MFLLRRVVGEPLVFLSYAPCLERRGVASILQVAEGMASQWISTTTPAVSVGGGVVFFFPSVWNSERGELPSMRRYCVDGARLSFFFEV